MTVMWSSYTDHLGGMVGWVSMDLLTTVFWILLCGLLVTWVVSGLQRVLVRVRRDE